MQAPELRVVLAAEPQRQREPVVAAAVRPDLVQHRPRVEEDEAAAHGPHPVDGGRRVALVVRGVGPAVEHERAVVAAPRRLVPGRSAQVEHRRHLCGNQPVCRVPKSSRR